MKPVEFEQQNTSMTAPKGMTEKECGVLPVHMDLVQNLTISCWELTDKEIDELKKTKRLYLAVFQVPTPPVSLQVDSPFEMIKDCEQLPIDEAIDLGD